MKNIVALSSEEHTKLHKSNYGYINPWESIEWANSTIKKELKKERKMENMVMENSKTLLYGIEL